LTRGAGPEIVAATWSPRADPTPTTRPAQPTTATATDPGKPAQPDQPLTAEAAAKRVARLFPEVYRRYHWAQRVKGAELPVSRRALEVLKHLHASGAPDRRRAGRASGPTAQLRLGAAAAPGGQGAHRPHPRRAGRAAGPGLADRIGTRRRLADRPGAGPDLLAQTMAVLSPEERAIVVRGIELLVSVDLSNPKGGVPSGRRHTTQRGVQPMTMAISCESCGMPLAGTEDQRPRRPRDPLLHPLCPGGHSAALRRSTGALHSVDDGPGRPGPRRSSREGTRIHEDDAGVEGRRLTSTASAASVERCLWAAEYPAALRFRPPRIVRRSDTEIVLKTDRPTVGPTYHSVLGSVAV